MKQNVGSSWKLAWQSGGDNRWSFGLRGPTGDEVVVRATTRHEAEAAVRALRSKDRISAVLQRAYGVLFVCGESECGRAAEEIQLLLEEMASPLATSRN